MANKTNTKTVNKTSAPKKAPTKTAAKPKVAPKAKTYKDTDRIVCRSITRGEMRYVGHKSGEVYIFANADDTCEIEVGDLNYLRGSKSTYIFDPLFVIEDEEFISQPLWKGVKELYSKCMSADINELIDLPLGRFKSILQNLPQGYKSALATEVATRIENEEFDSLSKIKAIDEFCGTDLYCLVK